MAWCQNPRCRKHGLSKSDVEFCEDTHMVLCTGCYALRHPGWMPPVDPEVLPAPQVLSSDAHLSYEVHFTSERGFTARVGYGQLSVGLHAPMEEIKKYFGVTEGPPLS